MTRKHLIFLLITLHNLNFLEAETRWIKSGYYDSTSNLPPSSINSGIFTHLYYAFASINSSTYNLSISDESSISSFTPSVKSKNPSIITILSIGLAYNGNYSTFSSMITHPSYRKSFITSSIQTARFFGFGGLDLSWLWPNSTSDMKNIGILLDEWRIAINSEAKKSTHEPPLVLSMAISRLPGNFPINSMKRNLDWVNFVAFDYHLPLIENVTGFHAALYDPIDHVDTDSGIRAWIDSGFPGNMVVLGLPYHGYAWELVSSGEVVGEVASGPGVTLDGSVGYKGIKSFISSYGYGVSSRYNDTYCVDYFVIKLVWVNFDDVEAIRTKVVYAKDKGLRGYYGFQLANDDNWKLSQAAYEVREDHEEKKKKKFLVKVLVPIAMVVLMVILGLVYFVRCKMFKSKGKLELDRVEIREIGPSREMNEHQEHNAPNLRVFTFSEIKAATSNFSCKNMLGEGGYGPVYKGELTRGQEIAVKRLSKTSNQGLKEYENEVKLTAKLQHVNLVRLLGYCTQKAEKMLVYEYMPNKSLDFYLFDRERRLKLDWEKRVDIIEGIAQGLLYLQEYSNFTIIHRDIKASNILLDERMKPKISDFGLARIFHKENAEAKTAQIVGTYGYVPPEYVKRGVYSTKYDVYSFGVVLLQIISGKKHSLCYGSSEDLNLLEYAYQLWKSDKGFEFIDPTLDDSFSPCKILMCLKVALLCVQESAMDRPTMLEVHLMLNNQSVDTIASPKRPAFSISEDRESAQEFCSLNSLTVSQIVAR